MPTPVETVTGPLNKAPNLPTSLDAPRVSLTDSLEDLTDEQLTLWVEGVRVSRVQMGIELAKEGKTKKAKKSKETLLDMLNKEEE